MKKTLLNMTLAAATSGMLSAEMKGSQFFSNTLQTEFLLYENDQDYFSPVSERKGEVAKTSEKFVRDEYGYFTYGFGFPALFGINLGKRVQSHHHGFEFGVGAVPLFFAYELHTFASYLFYPSPNLDSQVYIGFGARAGYGNTSDNHFTKGEFYGAPGIIFGRSMRGKKDGNRFMQIAVAPAILTEHGLKAFPSVSVSYGYCF